MHAELRRRVTPVILDRCPDWQEHAVDNTLAIALDSQKIVTLRGLSPATKEDVGTQLHSVGPDVLVMIVTVVVVVAFAVAEV